MPVSRRIALLRAIPLLIVICTLTLPAHAKYDGGTGEADDPYQVATAYDLVALGGMPEDYDKHFILTRDIDLNPKLPGRRVFDKAVIAPDSDPTKDSFQGTPFTGVFDGDGHTISHLTLVGARYVGLFGQLGGGWYARGGEIRNLGIVDVNAIGSGGGLVGDSYGSLKRCYSTGTVRNTDGGVGGLVGYNVGAVIECYSTASASGGGNVGGLIGFNLGAVVNCYSTGAVSGGLGTGGLVGQGSSVVNSFWDIETSGRGTSAAGKGRTTEQMKQAANYVGWNACGSVAWTINDGKDHPRLAWEHKVGAPIPPSHIADSLSGEGSPANPYLIENAEQFNMIGLYPCSWNRCFRLMADIDFEACQAGEYNVIGVSREQPFGGIFDGNGHTVSHVPVKGTAYLGVFGVLTSGGEIKDLGVMDVNIPTGRIGWGYIGGLVGYNSGVVTHCYSTGLVVTTTGILIGGLVGSNQGGTVTHCYSTCAVSGGSEVGGLIGYNYGPVTQCYSTSLVTGRSKVGGLIGHSYAPVTQCHSISVVRYCQMLWMKILAQ